MFNVLSSIKENSPARFEIRYLLIKQMEINSMFHNVIVSIKPSETEAEFTERLAKIRKRFQKLNDELVGSTFSGIQQLVDACTKLEIGGYENVFFEAEGLPVVFAAAIERALTSGKIESIPRDALSDGILKGQFTLPEAYRSGFTFCFGEEYAYVEYEPLLAKQQEPNLILDRVVGGNHHYELCPNWFNAHGKFVEGVRIENGELIYQTKDLESLASISHLPVFNSDMKLVLDLERLSRDTLLTYRFPIELNYAITTLIMSEPFKVDNVLLTDKIENIHPIHQLLTLGYLGVVVNQNGKTSAGVVKLKPMGGEHDKACVVYQCDKLELFERGGKVGQIEFNAHHQNELTLSLSGVNQYTFRLTKEYINNHSFTFRQENSGLLFSLREICTLLGHRDLLITFSSSALAATTESRPEVIVKERHLFLESLFDLATIPGKVFKDVPANLKYVTPGVLIYLYLDDQVSESRFVRVQGDKFLIGYNRGARFEIRATE